MAVSLNSPAFPVNNLKDPMHNNLKRKSKLILFLVFGVLMGNVAIANGQETLDRDATDDQTFVAKNAALRFIEERSIPCLASGVIKKSHVKEGTLVKPGQLIAEIDEDLARLDVQKLEKELAIAKKEASTTVELEYAKRSIEVAEAELKRATLANKMRAGAIADSEIDQLNLVVKKSIAEKDKTEFQIVLREMSSQVQDVALAIGRKKLANHQITSPIAGKVVEILKKEGEWVEVSESLARVVQLDKLKTEIRVPAALALGDLTGRMAVFRPNLKSLANKEYPATVIFVQPEANPVNASMRVWVEIDNQNLDLVPGLTGDLEIRPKSEAAKHVDAVSQK